MRVPAVLLPLLLLAGCAGSGPTPLPTEEATAAFPPHGIADVIVVNAVDRLPLRAAELIAPDGTATPASSIEVTRTPQAVGGQFAASDSYGSTLAGSSLGAPVPQDAAADAALRSQTRLLMTVATADIALPDAAAYRRDWQHYRIRLHFGAAPGAVDLREIPAPKPPAG